MIFKNMTRAERIQKLASNHPPAKDIGLTDCTIPDGMSQALARGGRVDA